MYNHESSELDKLTITPYLPGTYHAAKSFDDGISEFLHMSGENSWQRRELECETDDTIEDFT